jgi:ABC-type Mn2+/Zn2+ transport system permease subunit
VLFNILVAAVIIVSVRVLGVLLIAAAVVIPAAVARLVTRSFGRMLLVAVAVSVLATVAGLYVSFHADVASGASIVLVEAAAFGVVAVGTTVLTRVRLRAARGRFRAPPQDPTKPPALAELP